ncbi:MAG: M23 family metallopeptidase [Massilioclostridium sp.]|nr:M23 family metallopeptidase [Massilioclostridium sp.]MEE1491177.1 M23 family metallopeptidase [Massilioclostridium sp.]
MRKLKFGKSRTSGRGFYIALALSLVAVGAATFVAIDRTVGDLKGQTLELPSSSINQWGYPDDAEDVNNTQSDVPKTPSSEASSKPASSEPASSKEAEQTAAKESVFALPVNADITKGFSNGELVKSETMGDWRTHDGVDIKGDAGTPVKSASDGTVKEIKTDPMWGVCILIDHGNGYVGHYYGLNETVQVKVDQKVAVGDVIGSIGETNQLEIAEAPHLHFGLKKDDKWIDPMSVIK